MLHNILFFKQNFAEAGLQSVDIEEFIRFLSIEHEFNPQINHFKNATYIPYVRNISLLRGHDSKGMRKNIRSAIKR